MSGREKKYSHRSKKHCDTKTRKLTGSNQSITFPKVSVDVAEQGPGCNNCGNCGECGGDNLVVVSNLPSDAYPVPGCSDSGPIEPCLPPRYNNRYGIINRDCEEATGFK